MAIKQHKWHGQVAPFFCALWMMAGVARAAEDLRSLEEAAMQAAVTRVADSVVRIETFGGLERVGNVLVGVGPTTGLVVGEDGYIVSSAFNFAQRPSSILVTLADGKRIPARIVARDQSRMLVLLKVDVSQPLPVPEAVPIEQMRVGQWSLAVGRTLGDTPNLSVGVISALHRIWGKAIQTDAKISPSNYGGPLIDIRGRVLGILVPLSPQSQGEVAGAEWYDSGIGFAIPLVDVLARLDQWKQGQDLLPGILGIAFAGKNDYTDEPILAVVRVNSPAAMAGLRPGDQLLQINGEPTIRLAQVKHILGRLYAGDSVTITYERDGKSASTAAVLADRLVPYAHAYLGILPSRIATNAPGVVVHYVDPAGPAVAGGLTAGDRIATLNGNPVKGPDDLRTQLAQHLPDEKVQIGFVRGGEMQQAEVALRRLPTSIPEELPPAETASGPAPAERPATGKWQIQLPEEANTCWAWAPENLDPRVPLGMLLWLGGTGPSDVDREIEEWKAACQARGIVLVIPQPREATGWRVTELEFLQKVMEHVATSHPIDRQRVVVGGRQAGAAMAYLSAFTHRDHVRGVVVAEAALPPRVNIPDNEPLRRLAILTTNDSKSRLAGAVAAGVRKLREAEYPVTELDLTNQGGQLGSEQRAAIARWIDTLDRL